MPFLLASLLFLLREAIFGDFADLSHQISVVIGARRFVQINFRRTSPATYVYITSQRYSVVIRTRHFVQSISHRTSPKIYFYCTSQKYNILQHVALFKVILTVRHVQLFVTAARHRNTTYYSWTSSVWYVFYDATLYPFVLLLYSPKHTPDLSFTVTSPFCWCELSSSIHGTHYKSILSSPWQRPAVIILHHRIQLAQQICLPEKNSQQDACPRPPAERPPPRNRRILRTTSRCPRCPH